MASVVPTRSAPAVARASSINIVQYLCAREIALRPPYIRSIRARLKRKAVAAELDDPASVEEDTLPTPAAAVPRCSLLPCGSYPASFFSRALPIERLRLLFARPPPSLRFRLSDLFDLDRYPQLREHVFLDFDRTGLLLLSYLKTAAGAYSLHCWRFHPHRSLQLAASYALFPTLSDDSGPPLDEETSVRRQLGLDSGDIGVEEHLYIQLIEATDSSCFVVVGVAQDPSSGTSLNQSVKAHVSILPSPAVRGAATGASAFPTHQTHFSFVSSLRIPQVDLITLQDEFSSQPHTHCLTFVGIETLQCATFTISAAAAALQPPAASSTAASSSSLQPSTPLLDSDSHPLRRTSSLLSSALTRTDWLSDLVSVDGSGSPLPSPPAAATAAPPLISPWTLEIEVFVRDACVGSGRQMLDYGFTIVRVDGFRTSSTRSRTILLVLETGADSTRSSPSSNQFEASLLVWNMERLGEVERLPLPWSQSYLRRLLGVHKLACASSRCSDAERISQAGAHELLKSIARPMPLRYRRLTVTNAPLFTHKSRQLLLNTAFPFAVGL